MSELLLNQLPSLGIAGLLFVMWWYERQERVRAGGVTQASQCRAAQLLNINEGLLSVIRGNTEALTALREELQAHRANEREWFGRLAQEVERLADSVKGAGDGSGRRRQTA